MRGIEIWVNHTRAPLRGRLTPPASLAQGKEVSMQLKTCKGKRNNNAKSCLCQANYPVVLSCAVCFSYRCYVLIGSTGALLVGDKTGGRERPNTFTKRKKEEK